MSDARIVDYVDMAVLLSRETGLSMSQARFIGQQAYGLGIQPYVAYDLATQALAGGLAPADALEHYSAAIMAAVVPAMERAAIRRLTGHTRLMDTLGAWWRRVYRWTANRCGVRRPGHVSRETVGRHRT